MGKSVNWRDKYANLLVHTGAFKTADSQNHLPYQDQACEGDEELTWSRLLVYSYQGTTHHVSRSFVSA